MRRDMPALMELQAETDLFERLVERLYRDVLRPNDVCVDAGAHSGRHAFPMAEAVGTVGHVHCFEPIPFLADRLSEMAMLNYPQLSVHQAALSIASGLSTFQFVRDIPGWSGLRERQFSQHVESESISVQATTLDSMFWRLLPSWRFYKLDIEGGEVHAIIGSSFLIRKHKPVIVFENGGEIAAGIYGYSKADWFSVFDTIGYRPYDLYGYLITPDRWPDPGQPWNAIAVEKASLDESFILSEWHQSVEEVISECKTLASANFDGSGRAAP
jgi:FkbM family methyltransferase